MSRYLWVVLGVLLTQSPISLWGQLDAIDVSSVPAPERLLDEVSTLPVFQSPLAQAQALKFMEDSLYQLNFRVIGEVYAQPQKKARLQQISAQLEAAQNAYSEVRKRHFLALDESLRPQLVNTPDAIRLHLIDHYLPRQFIDGKQAEVAQMRKSVETRQARDEIETRLWDPINTGLLVALVLAVLYTLYYVFVSLVDREFDFDFRIEIGEVVRERKRSEVTIHETTTYGNSGGYGYNRGGAHSVSSSTKRFQEIFLRFEDGSERSMEFQDFKIPCREGHALFIAYAGRSDDDSVSTVAYHNFHTNNTHLISGAVNRAIRPPMWRQGRIGCLVTYFLATVFFCSVAGYFENGLGLGELIGIPFVTLLLTGVTKYVYDFLAMTRTAPRTGKVETALGRLIANTRSSFANA